MNELDPLQVTITDGFWGPRLATNASSALDHQWHRLGGTGCLDNFRLVSAEVEGFR